MTEILFVIFLIGLNYLIVSLMFVYILSSPLLPSFFLLLIPCSLYLQPLAVLPLIIPFYHTPMCVHFHLTLYCHCLFLLSSRLRLARMNEEMREAEAPLGQPGQYNSSSPTEQQYRKCIQEFICLTIEEC